MAPIDGLRVARSAIHGYGLFARRVFRAGELVTHGDGVLYLDEDFDDTYALVLPGAAELGRSADEAVYYDLADQTRWINHSCDPNCSVDARWDADLGNYRTWWTALRDIVVGEEITYDYAFAAHLAIPCGCAAVRCRGLIVDLDEVDELPAELRGLLRAGA